MTIANANSRQSFVAGALQTAFPFTISYVDAEENSVFKVFVDDVEIFNPADFTVTPTGAAVNSIRTGGTANLNVAPGLNAAVEVRRVSPKTQNNDYEGSSFPANTVELRTDRGVMVDQELQDEITALTVAPAAPAVAGNTIPDWVTGTDYVVDDAITFNGDLFKSTSIHTAGADFFIDLAAGEWVRVGTLGKTGPQGDPGPIGISGNDGNDGAAGAIGPDGADGIFSQIASLAEAQAGVDDTKGMTPLKTKSAIDTQVPALAVITTLQADVTAQNLVDQGLNTRLTALENMFAATFGIWKGFQTIRNGQAVPLDVAGAVSGEGNGAALRRDGDGTEFAEVMIYIKRTSDDGVDGDRFDSFTLVMQFVKGSWLIGIKDTDQLDETLELDGVTLSVNNLAGNIGQVQYVSDVMPGNYDLTNSYISFIGTEISQES